MPLESKLYIVGIGPGRRDHLTWQAAEIINRSDHVVGYKVYLDLVRDLLENKDVVSTGMGREVDRAKIAADLLEEGSVAFISSGDPNVYGMAGLGLEIAAEKVGLDRVEVVPGATSFTAAACRAGITFRDSVAVISLSDLLTAWTEIEQRVKTATEMKMPLALYNPRSKRRNWQLERVLEICIESGLSGQDLLVAKNVSRSGEELRWTTVAEMLEKDDLLQKIDMFTLIIIGGNGMVRGRPSSKSKINLIGIGPGNPDHITLEGRKLLKESDHILGAERYLRSVREIARGEMIAHNGRYDKRMKNSLAAAKAASDKCEMTSILVGGDPSLFSSAWQILNEECDIHLVPGLSAFSAVAAKLGAPLVNDFALLSGMRKKRSDERNNSLDKILRLMECGFGVVIYNFDSRLLSTLAEKIEDLDRPCALAQDVTRPEEKVIVCMTSDLDRLRDRLRFEGRRCTLVLSGPYSYIKNGRIITQRGYQSKYNYKDTAEDPAL
ncbi:MAG: SAM-dependent methyltransferase [Methanotrichaceae archaeon]